jgi:hypothetical protein
MRGKNCLRIAATIAVSLCALHLQCFAQTTTEATPPGTTSSKFFGIHIKDTTASLPIVKGLSFGAYRTLGGSVKWADIETSQGIYSFDRLDEWIADAQSSGEDIMFTAYATPHWASSNPNDLSCTENQNGGGICDAPKDWNTGDQNWIGFLTALINHVGPGVIKYYEFWNEFNVTSECNMTTAQLLQLDKDLYNTVHAMDPSALVTSPSISGLSGNAQSTVLLPYLQAGGSQYADVVAVHGYGGWPPEEISTGISSLKSVLLTAGMSTLPILISEGSWGENKPIEKSEDVAFVGRYYLLMLSGGIQKFYWYGWDFPSVNLINAGKLTAAGTAVQQIMAWTVGQATPVCTTTGTTYTCAIGQTTAMWDTAGTPTVSTSKAHYSNLEEQTFAVVGGKVKLGSEPILLY